MNARHHIETAVSNVLDRQARALPSPEREWHDVPVVEITSEHERNRRTRYVRGALVVAALAATLLVAVLLVERARETRSEPAHPPPTVPLRVETKQVSLSADDFSIEVGGRRFTGTKGMRVNSDPGANDYTTLELEWVEHGVEMRLYMYFTSDGKDWWSDEIRTYDGREDGEWITYKGMFFRTSRGEPFEGDVDLTRTRSDQSSTGEPIEGPTGTLRLGNLRLEAFRRPAGCADPAREYVLVADLDETDPAEGLGVTLYDAASCRPVPDPERFTYEWTVADPSVATVFDGTSPTATPQPPHGDLASVMGPASGETTVHVAAIDRENGKVVAATDIKVKALEP